MRVSSVLLALFFLSFQLTADQGTSNGNVASMERKLQRIASNGSTARRDPAGTVFSDDEINAYFAAGKVQLPAGVRSVRFQAEPGAVRATTRVDFDQLQAGRTSMNPLLSIFSGVHDAVVTAQAHGAGGVGYVQVDSVSLDGVEIPRFALQLFVEKYLQPKYPDVGLDSKFPLPDRIETATIGAHTLTVVQK
jgi:hypothetical protein